jgi:dolichol-phosphate mannosyltransferase
MPDPSPSQPPHLSVVVPLLNEQDNLRELHRRVRETMLQMGVTYELIFVDDGSTDASVSVIQELAQHDAGVRGLSLSRNFGHEAASTAGLDAARGQAIVLMDADLQDPPELIADMHAAWKQGHQIVFAKRRKREGETALKRFTSALFYRVLHKLSDTEIPLDTGDYRLIDRAVLDALKQCREVDRFVRGLVAWTGFKSTAVEYDRPARFAGETKYNYGKLLVLALDAVVGYSTTPLRIATWLGFFVTLFALGLTLVVSVQRVFFPRVPMFQGYALLTGGVFFLGGVQLMMLGILGEYLGRTYRQVQGRPIYIVGRTIGATDHA